MPYLSLLGTVRIINTSSVAHIQASRGIVFNNINLHDSSTLERYGQSKLANILLTKELVRR
jgi:NAD(P)-dependent dehydrogenase (short-subunit alcohol dehydrogenase family)